MKCWMVVALAGCILAATASPIIKPRPVDNTRDPHDGEPFEWEPVDDDPWPGPSFTFPQLPSTDALETGGRPSSSAGIQAQAAFLMQFLRALFNNNNNNNHNSNKNNVRRGGNWYTSANEVGSSSDWIRQKKP